MCQKVVPAAELRATGQLVGAGRASPGPCRVSGPVWWKVFGNRVCCDGADICVIAGYWAHSSRWKCFRKHWNETLTKFAVPLDEFHATRLINNRSDEPLLRELAGVIVSYPMIQ
jgi:hypothetical protein